MEGGGDEGIESRVEDSKDLQQQSKALDKLTDHVEDRQLDSSRVQEVLFSNTSNLILIQLLLLIYLLDFNTNCYNHYCVYRLWLP